MAKIFLNLNSVLLCDMRIKGAIYFLTNLLTREEGVWTEGLF